MAQAFRLISLPSSTSSSFLGVKLGSGPWAHLHLSKKKAEARQLKKKGMPIFGGQTPPNGLVVDLSRWVAVGPLGGWLLVIYAPFFVVRSGLTPSFIIYLSLFIYIMDYVFIKMAFFGINTLYVCNSSLNFFFLSVCSPTATIVIWMQKLHGSWATPVKGWWCPSWMTE